jgi:hypothetical protein
MWTLGSQTGHEYRTALGQVYMDPRITIGKAYLWAAIPRYFLPNAYPKVYKTPLD